MQIFPAPAPPTQPSPLVPPHAPPPPPANYDEEAAAQAARGYTAVYAYPAYAYPGQVSNRLIHRRCAYKLTMNESLPTWWPACLVCRM